MHRKQYNNVIEWTLEHDESAKTGDSLATARAICNNLGVPLPQGDCKEVLNALATGDYMGWTSCTAEEAREAVENGTATIGVSEDSIVVFTAMCEDEFVTETSAIMTFSDIEPTNSTQGLIYYSYSNGSTGQGGNNNTCYPSNSLFDFDNKADLLNDLISILGDRQDVASIYSTTECVNTILDYDGTITNYCNLYCVPKEFVQTLILRELWCVDLTDIAADEAVMSYFRWKKECEIWSNYSTAEQMIIPYPEAPLVMREDCSTGIGQMFAEVAIYANNLARFKGLINTRAYDKDDWHDCRDVWFALHNDDDFAIKMTSLEMYHCADYVGVSGSLFRCTETQIKAIFARYNGTGTSAEAYGNECFKYYKIFKKYS